jgi:nitrogen fixation protein NifT
MPNVMLRNNAAGQLVFYITKKDHEETVVALEHSGPGAVGW